MNAWGNSWGNAWGDSWGKAANLIASLGAWGKPKEEDKPVTKTADVPEEIKPITPSRVLDELLASTLSQDIQARSVARKRRINEEEILLLMI